MTQLIICYFLTPAVFLTEHVGIRDEVEVTVVKKPSFTMDCPEVLVPDVPQNCSLENVLVTSGSNLSFAYSSQHQTAVTVEGVIPG